MRLSPAQSSPGKLYFSRNHLVQSQDAEINAILANEPESDLLKALKAAQPDSNSTQEPETTLHLPLGSSVAEELCWKGTSVVWSKGNVVHNVFDFRNEGTEGGLVVKALFGWFDLSDPSSASKQSKFKAETRNDLFGPFLKPADRPWSDESHQKPQQASQQAVGLQRAICVFLRDLLHLYFPMSGETYTINMPFLSARAWALDVGLLLERATQKGESDRSVPVMYSFTDPFDELRVASTCETFATTVSADNKAVSPLPAGALATFLELQEKIIFCSRGINSDPKVLVTHNAENCKVSLYQYTTLLEPLPNKAKRFQPNLSAAANGESDISQFAPGDPRRGLEDLRGNTTLAPGLDKRSRAVDQSMNIDRMPLDREPSIMLYGHTGHMGVGDGIGNGTAVDHMNDIEEEDEQGESNFWLHKMWSRTFDSTE